MLTLRPWLPTYFMHDQPTTCPMCGARTEWIGEDPQFHECRCGYQFFVEEEVDPRLPALDTVLLCRS